VLPVMLHPLNAFTGDGRGALVRDLPTQQKSLIFNASAVQARNPINRRSVQGWRRTADVLEPARKCLIRSGLFDSTALTV